MADIDFGLGPNTATGDTVAAALAKLQARLATLEAAVTLQNLTLSPQPIVGQNNGPYTAQGRTSGSTVTGAPAGLTWNSGTGQFTGTATSTRATLTETLAGATNNGRQSVVRAASASLGSLSFTAGSTPSGVTVTGGANGTVINSSGTLVSSAAPRYDYSGGVASLLIEPASTNLAQQSRSIGTSPWSASGHNSSGSNDATKAPTLSIGAQAGFDGAAGKATRAAFKAVASSGSNASEMSALQYYITGLTVGQTYTKSVYAKGVAGGEVLPMYAQAGAGQSYGLLGKVTSAALSSSAWTRVTLTFTATTTDAYISIGQDGFYTGAGAAMSIDLDMYQIEPGTVATSPIITTTAAVTRSADAASVTVPAGVDRLDIVFRGGRRQTISATGGASRALPTNLNYRHIASITGRSTATDKVVGVSYNTPKKYNSTPGKSFVGDTFFPTWTAGDVIFTPSCDTVTNWDGASPTTNANTAVSKLSSDADTYSGTMVNVLAMLGTSTQAYPSGSGETWKAGGLIAIGDVLYLAISRNKYAQSWFGSNGATGGRQSAFGGQIIKSSDGGLTWTPATPGTAQPYAAPMFSGTNAGTLMFVQGASKGYLNEYAAGMDQYVYGLTFTYWNDGDKCTGVGRCLITDMASLDATKWSWRQSDGTWVAGNSGLATAAAPYTNTGKVGQFTLCFVPKRDRFIGIPWWYQSYVDSGSVTMNPETTNDTTWDLVEGDTPWNIALVTGASKRWNAASGSPGRGLYQPTAFPSSLGIDGGDNISMLSTGSFASQSASSGDYCPTHSIATLSVET